MRPKHYELNAEQIEQLSPEWFEQLYKESAAALAGIEEGSSICLAKAYRGQSWSQVRSSSSDGYKLWRYCCEQERKRQECFEISRARREREERQRQQAAAREQGQQTLLFNDKEGREIHENGLDSLIWENSDKGYRQQARENHPDHGGSEEKMRRINRAKEFHDRILDAVFKELRESLAVEKTGKGKGK